MYSSVLHPEVRSYLTFRNMPFNMVLRAQALRGMLHEFYMPALRAQQEWGNADVAASEEFLGLLEKFDTILAEAVRLPSRCYK